MSTGRWRVGVAAIVILAAAVRLWGLAEYPPGLYPDQAANGEDALEILSGNLQVFSLRNNGRESLLFYVQALTLGLFGVGVFPLFLASAVVGIATVAVTTVAGARLFSRPAALLAGLALATNPWHVTLSRTGFRAVMTPLLLALACWFLAWFLRWESGRPRGRAVLLGGFCTGLGLYTYPAFRAFGVFLVLWVLGSAVAALCSAPFRSRMRSKLWPLGLAALTAFLTSLPLLLFFAAHPDAIGVRAQHVSVFNPDLNDGAPGATFLRMTGRTLRAFLRDGDGNPRHNVPLPDLPYTAGGIHHYRGGGWPFLSPVPAALALVGVFVAVRRARWLLLLFPVMLLPAITTAEGIPHGLRSAGAIPAHVWLAGLGGAYLLGRLRGHPSAGFRWSLAALAIVAGLSTTATDVWAYFGLARNSPLAHYEYRADLTVASAYLNDYAKRQTPSAPERGRAPYLVLDDFSALTVHFLTTPTGHAYRLLRPEESSAVDLRPGEQIIFTQSTLPDASRYLATHRDVQVAADRANRFGETVVLILARSPSTARFQGGE